jgi:hypothetical protein
MVMAAVRRISEQQKRIFHQRSSETCQVLASLLLMLAPTPAAATATASADAARAGLLFARALEHRWPSLNAVAATFSSRHAVQSCQTPTHASMHGAACRRNLATPFFKTFFDAQDTWKAKALELRYATHPRGDRRKHIGGHTQDTRRITRTLGVRAEG